MNRKKVDLSAERQLITHLIVSDRFANQVLPILDPTHLSVPYTRIVAGWIKEYWERYKTSPGKQIGDIWRAKRKELFNEDEADNVAEFLRRLSKDWESASVVNNIPYAVANATEYLKLRSITVLHDQLKSVISSEDAIGGEQLLANYKRVETPTGQAVSITRDPGPVAKAFLEEDEVLFQFPKALGIITGKLHRGDFLGFMGPMKRGKSWWLWYTAETAMHYGLKVVFITLEMTQNQMLRRGWQSLVGQPAERSRVRIPFFVKDSDEGKWEIDYKEEERAGISAGRVSSQQAALRPRLRGGDIRVIALPADSATMDDIDAHLDNLVFYEGFVPDVIITDYADIVAASRGSNFDYRHQLDDIWKRHRRMGQERNALIATASQTDRSTFDTDVTQSKVAEDIRKLAHVTCMLGLNQRSDEADDGIMRVSQIAIREGRKHSGQVIALQCLDIGRVCIDSKMRKDVIIGDEPKRRASASNRRKRSL